MLFKGLPSVSAQDVAEQDLSSGLKIFLLFYFNINSEAPQERKGIKAR